MLLLDALRRVREELRRLPEGAGAQTLDDAHLRRVAADYAFAVSHLIRALPLRIGSYWNFVLPLGAFLQ